MKQKQYCGKFNKDFYKMVPNNNKIFKKTNNNKKKKNEGLAL